MWTDLDRSRNIAAEIHACEENLAAIRRALVEPLPIVLELATMHDPPRFVDNELQTWPELYRIVELVL